VEESVAQNEADDNRHPKKNRMEVFGRSEENAGRVRGIEI
jgi:hypothetical protein